MAPVTDPISTKGVQPLNSRSPEKSTERSGIQTMESLVVWAGDPTWRSSQRRSSTHTATSSR